MNDQLIRGMDRISDLPRNIIESILERMPIRDAARTSILSTKWRRLWTTISQLVLDNQFFKETLKTKPIVRHELVGSIEKILLLHNGPILKFVLCIPRIQFDCSLDIDRWMLFLLRNGIKDLTLCTSGYNPYDLHSCMYSCPEVTRLYMVNCIFRPPQELSVFHNLIRLQLVRITCARDMLGTLLSRCPLLEILIIGDCNGIGHFNIHAPKLKKLILYCNHELESISFTGIHNLTYVLITVGLTVVSPASFKVPNVVDFLGYLPRIAELHLDGPCLKVLAAGGVPHGLPTRVNLLKSLTLYNTLFNDLDCISCALYLIKSCPNLTELCLWFFGNEIIEEAVIDYLEAPDCMDQMLDKLRSVTVRYHKGSKPELLFIKLLLSYTPMLETMFIEHNPRVRVAEGFEISKELARFPRLSPKAVIIY